MYPDPLLIRSISLFAPIIAAWLVWLARPPSPRQAAGALLASVWLVPSLLGLHLLAQRFGWWSYHAEGGLFLGFPVDLYLGWIILWGALPMLATPRVKLFIVLAILLALDIIYMPLAYPVVILHPTWLVGELVALFLCLLPAQLLGRWTMDDARLPYRLSLIVIAFAAITYGLLPTIILEATGGSWQTLLSHPLWLNSLALQLLALPAMIGLSAVQEFARRGGGTPIPFDPPKHLVTSGPYAHIANPMQFSTALTLLGWGLLLDNVWVSAAGLMSFIYSAGLAAWSEGVDLEKRFGPAWKEYRQNVRTWCLRWRPWFPPDAPPATLYVATTCLPCSELAQWFSARHPIGLTLAAAEHHPTQDLLRLTYDPGDGSPPEQGLAALACGLEHIHLGYAFIGWTLRLPLVDPLLQLLVDAVGGGPRLIPRSSLTPDTPPKNL